MTLPLKTIKWAFDFASWQPTELQILQAFSCIQPEEKERISRCLFKRDAKASLVGRLLIRKFLAENTSVKYNEIILKRDSHGKPFASNEILKGRVNFNVSHHGSLVIFAGHLKEAELGVDVMSTKFEGNNELSEFFRLMSRNFSSREWDVIKYTNPIKDIQVMLFNRHWALKESYVKAVGIGITIDLSRIEFKIHTKFMNADTFTNDTELFVDGIRQEDWIFQETLLKSDHLVSIAVHSKENADSSPFVFLSFDDIVKNAVKLSGNDFSMCQEFFSKKEAPF